MGPSASSARSFSTAAGTFRRTSTRIVVSRTFNALPPAPEGLLEGLIRPRPRGLHLPELLVRDVRPRARELEDAPPPSREPPDHVAEALPVPLLLREHLVHVVRHGDVPRHLILCIHMHMYILCALDLLLRLQEDRQDREDGRVHVRRVARRARVLSRLAEDAVERLPVLLPQRAAIVHPVVQDRL